MLHTGFEGRGVDFDLASSDRLEAGQFGVIGLGTGASCTTATVGVNVTSTTAAAPGAHRPPLLGLLLLVHCDQLEREGRPKKGEKKRKKCSINTQARSQDYILHLSHPESTASELKATQFSCFFPLVIETPEIHRV